VAVLEGLGISGPGGGKGEGTLSSVAEGAVLEEGKARTGWVDGGRRVGLMGDARYIKGAKAEAVFAVEAWDGEKECKEGVAGDETAVEVLVTRMFLS